VRIDDRLRRLVKNIFGSAAARLFNLLIVMALIPLTINALSVVDYAFLSMAISLSVLSAYADFGIGLAIVNTLAGESKESVSEGSRKAVSVVWFTLLTIACVALIVTGGLALWVYHYAPIADIPRYQAMLLGSACVFVGLPSGLIQRILFARHRTTEANAWTTSGRLLSLLFVWGVVESGAANLSLLVFGVIGVPVIIGWISVLVVFRRSSMKPLVPRFKYYDHALLKPYLMTGLSFLILQVVPYAEVGINTLLAGSLIGIDIVPSLDVYTRLYTYVPALVSIALFPLWPEIANAKAEGNGAWILKITRWAYYLTGMLAFVISLILLLFGEQLVNVWTHQNLTLPSPVLTGMAVFAVLTCIGTVQSMVLNGAGVIKQQVQLYIVYLLILFSAKILATSTLGLVGMIWSLNACQVLRLVVGGSLLRSHIKLTLPTPLKTSCP
jgi:O-antigen/teichoic acid export membrane protein